VPTADEIRHNDNARLGPLWRRHPLRGDQPGITFLMVRSGYVKIHRSFLEWEWFADSTVMHVFVYLLLSARWKDGKWKGIDVPAGSTITSYGTIAASCGLTEKQARRAMDALKSADVIHVTRAGKGQLVTLVKWGDYQEIDNDEGREEGSERAGRGQDEGRMRATLKEGKKRESARATSITSLPFEAFREACLAVHREHKILPDTEAKAFFEYWTEGHPAVKPRYARQQVFDIAKRMRTWLRNNESKTFQADIQPQPAGIKSYKL
jgi:hypothetical protein